MKKVLALGLAVCAFFSCSHLSGKKEARVGEAGGKVTAYLRTWPMNHWAPNPVNWTAADIKGEYLTDLIISFANIDAADGTSIFIPSVESKTPYGNNPNAEIAKKPSDATFTGLWKEVAAIQKKYPALKVHISIGGWEADGFSAMAADPAKKAAFIANVIKWVKEYKLDGVDIDWEYPVGPDWGGLPIDVSPADRQNYPALLRDMRAALDKLGKSTKKTYSLSSAIPASGWFAAANDLAEAAKYLDTFKLMAYDYFGGWTATTGHHANLYISPQDTTQWPGSTDTYITSYLNAGVPANKISLGLGTYGRAWKGVPDGGTHGLYQPVDKKNGGGAVFNDDNPDRGTISWSNGSPNIKELLADKNYTRYYDDVAKQPYLYNEKAKIFVSYTDEQQIKDLCAYAKEKGLSGIFYWEYGHDKDGELLKFMAEDSAK
jgi:chitinase